MTKKFAAIHDGYLDLSVDDLRQGQVDPKSVCEVMTSFGRVRFKNVRPGTWPSELVRFAESMMLRRYKDQLAKE